MFEYVVVFIEVFGVMMEEYFGLLCEVGWSDVVIYDIV